MELNVIGTGSAGNCYVLTDQRGGRLMLEAGVSIPVTLRALDFDTSRLAGIVVTHEHKDHCGYARQWAKRGQRIYASKGTFEGMSDNSLQMQTARCEMEAGGLYHIGSYLVRPFRVEHDAREPFGYLILHSENKLFFITDTCSCNVVTKGVETFMVECNYDLGSLNNSEITEGLKARIFESHFSLTSCKEFLKRQDLSQCKRIIAVHASGERLDKERAVEELQAATGVPVIVATNGLTIEL